MQREVNTNLCLPVIAPKFDQLIKILDAQENGYKFLELWLDYLPPLSVQRLRQLGEKYKNRLIILFRRRELEATQSSTADVIQSTKELQNFGAWCDFDLRTQDELLSSVEQRVPLKKVILSYHNYDSTPSYEVLTEQVDKLQNRAKKYPEYIIKLACQCKDDVDAFHLIRIMLLLKKKGLRFCVTGMGDFGKVVRLAGTLLGNAFEFVPATQDKASAVGQFTRQELFALVKAL